MTHWEERFAMRRDRKIDLWYWIAAAALAIALMPAADLLHDVSLLRKWSIFLIALALALACFLRAVFLAWRDEEEAPKHERRQKMIALVGMIIFGLGFLGCAEWFFWPQAPQKLEDKIEAKATSETEKASQPPQLEDLFARDFNFLSIDRTISMHMENPAAKFETNIEIKLRIFRDFDSNTEFVAVLIPFLTDTRLTGAAEGIIEKIKVNIKQAREEAKLIGVESSSPGTSLVRSKDLIFSGRVFVYTLNSLDAVERGRLVQSYRNDGMFLEIRGAEYLFYRAQNKN
jgi:hypothetical protein